MTDEDWIEYKNAKNCHICNKSLIKDEYLDSLPVFKIEEGWESSYRGQWHKRCYYMVQKQQQEEQKIKKEVMIEENDIIEIKKEAERKVNGILTLKRVTEKKDQERAKAQVNCYFFEKPLLQKNFRDAVKHHCHMTGAYRGAAHNACNLKMRIKPKTDQIPIVFHNLRGYGAHHLIQAMSNLQKEVKCVANNMEKYITFSVRGLRFIDSLNLLQGSLDSLVRATPKESLKITSTISNGSDLLYKKGIYPYEYMDSWARFSETSLPDKEKFYSKLNDEHITED